MPHIYKIPGYIYIVLVCSVIYTTVEVHSTTRGSDKDSLEAIHNLQSKLWEVTIEPVTLAKPDYITHIKSTTNFTLPQNEISLYELPYSVTTHTPDWHRLWINTATLSGAFIGSLLVLECLPEDATSWNRAELQDVPLFKRWHNHVIKKGPEWDNDKFYFNYILHPYAGAAYFMAARSCGFNAWQSLLYCACISTIGWEFGIEAFMERPSIQDIFITPIVGGLIGEGFYKAKRSIVNNGYKLAGSSLLGNAVAFIIDPVNEVIGLFNGNPCRKITKRSESQTNISSSMVFHTNGNLHFGLSTRFIF